MTQSCQSENIGHYNLLAQLKNMLLTNLWLMEILHYTRVYHPKKLIDKVDAIKNKKGNPV